MIKTEQKGKRIKLTRKSKPNFSTKTLPDQRFLTPQCIKLQYQVFLEINSISQYQSALSKSVKQIIEQQINTMLDQIARIINEFNVSMREAMNYVRSSILFKQIDEINTNIVNEIVGEFARNKIEALEAAVQVKNQQIQQLKNQIKQEQDFNEQKLKIHKVPKLDLSRQNEKNKRLLTLYNKAKTSPYQDFQQLYKRKQLSNRVQFIHISNVPNKNPKYPRQQTKFIDFKQQKEGKLIKVLTPLLNNISQEERTVLLGVLNEQLFHECQNPCCKWMQVPTQDRNRMAILNPNKKEIKNNSFYTTDKFSQYHKRYYHSAFHVDKIRSVTKTQTEQMQRLYKIQKNKQKLWKKKKIRSQSTV